MTVPLPSSAHRQNTQAISVRSLSRQLTFVILPAPAHKPDATWSMNHGFSGSQCATWSGLSPCRPMPHLDITITGRRSSCQSAYQNRRPHTTPHPHPSLHRNRGIFCRRPTKQQAPWALRPQACVRNWGIQSPGHPIPGTNPPAQDWCRTHHRRS